MTRGDAVWADPIILGEKRPFVVRDSREVAELFAGNLARAHTGGLPELLVTPDCRTLFAPTEPFMTMVDLMLPVGRQRPDVLHVSDHRPGDGGDRGGRGPMRPAAGRVLSQAFEPRPLRLGRRHLGVGHVNKGGPWMFDEPH